MTKIFLSLILSGLLWINPILAQNNPEERLNKLYIENANLTYKNVLEIGLQAASTEKERSEFKKGLAVLEKNPALGNVSVAESIDSMAYFFLNNLEKDFIAFPKSYAFYKGFRSVFRGQKFQHYNTKCVYNRNNAIPFNMLDFINGKYPCAAPKNYPKKTPKYQIMEGVEKALTDLDKKVSDNFYETGKSFGEIVMSFLIPDAYGISEKGKNLASYLLIASGVLVIVLGVAFTPIAAIGIPVIALGIGAVVAGIGMGGWALSDKIKKKRNRSQ